MSCKKLFEQNFYLLYAYKVWTEFRSQLGGQIFQSDDFCDCAVDTKNCFSVDNRPDYVNVCFIVLRM